MYILVYMNQITETQELKKWGNSLGIRIPKRITKLAHVAENQLFTISLDKGSIVLTPTQEPSTELKRLLEGITPEIIGGEWDTGPSVGREIIDDIYSI
jgi:antitoxin MazE